MNVYFVHKMYLFFLFNVIHFLFRHHSCINKLAQASRLVHEHLGPPYIMQLLCKIWWVTDLKCDCFETLVTTMLLLSADGATQL